MDVEIQGSIIFPSIPGDQNEAFTQWQYWSARQPLCQDNRPAQWLSNPFLRQRGVYIWTLPRNDGGQRLLHVGCVYGKHSTLRERTLAHYNNYHAFSWHQAQDEACIRRLDRLPIYDYKASEIRGYKNDASAAEINDLLATIRVIYLSPEHHLEPDSPLLAEQRAAIKLLEGGIVRAAFHAFGDKTQLSNTVERTMNCKHFAQIAEILNKHQGIGSLFP